MSAMQMLDADMMFEVMSRPKPNQKETLKLDLESLRAFFPAVVAFFETEEGNREFEEWKAKKEAEKNAKEKSA